MNLLWLGTGLLLATLVLLAFTFTRRREPIVRSQLIGIVSLVCLIVAMLFTQLPTSQFRQVMTWVLLVVALALLVYDVIVVVRNRFGARAGSSADVG